MINGHGDDSYKYTYSIKCNFSSNIYHKAPLNGLKNHLCQRMDCITHYPEPVPYSLEKELAAYHHLNPEEICVTNGCTEAIYLIAQAFRESKSLVFQPTFTEYADACQMHKHQLTSFYQWPSKQENYLLPAKQGLCWICNPNNPTGEVIPPTYLRQLITHNPSVCFIIDQSYEAFTQQELFSASEAAALPQVLLLHSMTKEYAIPGLRLGYITGNAALLEKVRCYRMPWSVNQLAIEAGHYILNHLEEMQPDLTTLLAETAWLRQSLIKLGIVDVWDTNTHFMLASLRWGTAASLKDFLANNYGILIRDASNFVGLDARFFRIATQSHEENMLLIEAMKEWIETEL